MHGLETIIRRNNDAADRMLGRAQERFEDAQEVLPAKPEPQPVLPVDAGDSDES
jgi:hypothetical protein